MRSNRGAYTSVHRDFSRLLHRQVGRLLALENPTDIVAGEAVSVRNVRSVTQQTSGRGEPASLVDRWHRVAESQRGKLFPPTVKKRSGPSTSPLARNWISFAKTPSKSRSVLAFKTWSSSPKLGAAACISFVLVSATVELAGLTSRAMTLAVGTNSCSNCSRFGPISTFVLVTPVALPPGRLRLATSPSWTGVGGHFENDRNGCIRCLCRKRRLSARRSYHGHLTMDQISHHRRQLISSTLRPAVFDRDVAANDVTGFAQPSEKG